MKERRKSILGGWDIPRIITTALAWGVMFVRTGDQAPTTWNTRLQKAKARGKKGVQEGCLQTMSREPLTLTWHMSSDKTHLCVPATPRRGATYEYWFPFPKKIPLGIICEKCLSFFRQHRLKYLSYKWFIPALQSLQKQAENGGGREEAAWSTRCQAPGGCRSFPGLVPGSGDRTVAARAPC